MVTARGEGRLPVTMRQPRLADNTLLVADRALFLEVAVESLENRPANLLTHFALKNRPGKLFADKIQRPNRPVLGLPINNPEIGEVR